MMAASSIGARESHDQGSIEGVEQPVLGFFPGHTIANQDADKGTSPWSTPVLDRRAGLPRRARLRRPHDGTERGLGSVRITRTPGLAMALRGHWEDGDTFVLEYMMLDMLQEFEVRLTFTGDELDVVGDERVFGGMEQSIHGVLRD